MEDLSKIQWQWRCFTDFTAAQMHEILAVRQEVFVVEQKCVYLDADCFDCSSFHLLGRAEDGQLGAYARLSFPGSRYQEPSIGRLLTTASYRGRGLGRMALRLAIKKSRREYPGKVIRISAQLHLESFYGEFGFRGRGLPYDEDGIAHIDMFLEQDG
ncbi:GNAT family N-acetyltransferase [Desulfopila inferna]|uniref:GNAT family N-acetyltransferase n=1 Tax=Desulfopila inferna TaxID=468528 RepID=UPI00196308F2|nr:GNAT family N-acetyltransferase [Desulfopila inferna]